METEKTELGKRSYKSGILRKKFCYLFMWGANKSSRLGIEIIGGKDILPLECFGIQGCLERDSMGIWVSLGLECLLGWAMRGMVVEGVGLGTIFCVGMYHLSTKKYKTSFTKKEYKTSRWGFV